MVDRKDINIAETLRQFIDYQISGIYTITSCIVEAVDSQTRRVEVSLKTDRGAIIDNVPIASPFASDGSGIVFPVQQDNEGILLHTKKPLGQQIPESGHVEVQSERRYELESAIFLPMVWTDDMEVPQHSDGEFILSMQEDGSDFVMSPDGSVSVEHPSGAQLGIGPEGTISIDGADQVEMGADQVEIAGSGVSITSDGQILVESGDIALGDGTMAQVLNESAILEYEDTGDTEDGSAIPTTKQVDIVDPGTEDTEAS